MKKWVCPVCGYVHEGDTPPEKCPVCKVPGERFTLHEHSRKQGRPIFSSYLPPHKLFYVLTLVCILARV